MKENLLVPLSQLKIYYSRKDEGVHDLSCSHNLSQCVVDQNEVGLQLPLVKIAKFDGSCFRWMEFCDTLRSFIYDNDKVTQINKFYYLVSYLEGKAARTNFNLEVSYDSYKEAWDLLLQFYNNKRLLISHYINALFNINPIVKESESSLRFLVDDATKNLDR